MTWARPAFRWLVWIILACVAVQFFLAGLGVAELGGESIDPHQGLGSLIELLALILLILAFVAKESSMLKGMSAVLLILAVLQSVWANIDDPEWLRSFHVFDAFLIVGLLMHMSQRIGWPLSPERQW